MLCITACGVALLAVAAGAVTASEEVTVEKDGDVCERMCSANYSDVLEECKFGCEHRSGLRERFNPFNQCFNSCESRFKMNILSRTNETEWVKRAWDACFNACQLPYKTKIRWNVYIDLRSGEPIWNFEKILSDEQKIFSAGMGYEELINSASLHKSDSFPGRSNTWRYWNPFTRFNVHEADNEILQSFMIEMLNKVRKEMSRMQRFDGIPSIDYIGPRVIEQGPHGPTVTDITELQYRPKEVVIYNSHVRRDERILFIYLLLLAFVITTIGSLAHLRKYHLLRMHTRRQEMAQRGLMNNDVENGDWTKKIPIGTAPPSYSSPEK